MPAQILGFAATNKWPGVNWEQVEAVCSDGYGLADLWELSPFRIEDSTNHTEQFIDSLFPGNPLICTGRNRYRFDTKPREEWRGGLAEREFIVPNPMSAIRGQKADGGWSKRTAKNVGPRRFLVVEFDSREIDQQAELLVHLATYAPLACALHSGNKSLHGWFYVAQEPEAKVRRFMAYAVSLGADPATWTPCQFVRMPDGKRENGNRQTVYYFNPNYGQKHD